MRRTIVPIVLVALVAGACGGSEEPAVESQGQAEQAEPAVPASPPTDRVDATSEKSVKVELVDATTLTPSCLIVDAGTEFEVANVDEFTGHTFTISEVEFHRTPFILNSGRMAAGAEATLDPVGADVATGGYPMFCIYHPLMKGELYVR